MNHFLYNVATTTAAPFGAIYLAMRKRYRPLLNRFDPPLPKTDGMPVWLHACSVGEFAVARPLCGAIEERWPRYPTIVSVSTVTAHDVAEKSPIADRVIWFPFDQAHIVSRLFNKMDPRALILIETELWPNVLHVATKRRVPVAVVNARISDKHFPRYKKWGDFATKMFRQINLVCAQNDTYAKRYIELGTPPDRVQVTGNLKFDGVATSIDPAQVAVLRNACHLEQDENVIVFGSTRPGDEALALECYESIKARHPNLRLVIAPRHVDRVPEIIPLLRSPNIRLSQIREGNRPEPGDIILVDTIGDLTQFYAMANLAVVGGSFYPGVEGHNPIEPTALGIPTIFGPYMANFRDAADVLVSANGAIQLSGPTDLDSALQTLLTDTEKRKALARRGREAVLSQQGATQRTLDLLGQLPAWEP